MSCDESPMLNRKGLGDSFSTTTAASALHVRSLMYLQTHILILIPTRYPKNIDEMTQMR